MRNRAIFRINLSMTDVFAHFPYPPRPHGHVTITKIYVNQVYILFHLSLLSPSLGL